MLPQQQHSTTSKRYSTQRCFLALFVSPEHKSSQGQLRVWYSVRSCVSGSIGPGADGQLYSECGAVGGWGCGAGKVSPRKTREKGQKWKLGNDDETRGDERPFGSLLYVCYSARRRKTVCSLLGVHRR